MKQAYQRIVRLEWLLNPTLLTVMMMVVVMTLPTFHCVMVMNVTC